MCDSANDVDIIPYICSPDCCVRKNTFAFHRMRYLSYEFTSSIIFFGSICNFATMFKKCVETPEAVVRYVLVHGRQMPADIRSPATHTEIMNVTIHAIVHDGTRRMPCWLGCTREM